MSWLLSNHWCVVTAAYWRWHRTIDVLSCHDFPVCMWRKKLHKTLMCSLELQELSFISMLLMSALQIHHYLCSSSIIYWRACTLVHSLFFCLDLMNLVYGSEQLPHLSAGWVVTYIYCNHLMLMSDALEGFYLFRNNRLIKSLIQSILFAHLCILVNVFKCAPV